jgi:hypothetical protein
MGETAGKLEPLPSHDEVVFLRRRILQKRDSIAAGLEILKDRRQDAINKTRKTAQALGVASVVIVGLFSLVRLLINAFSSEDRQPVRSATGKNFFQHLSAIIMTSLEIIAAAYVRRRLNDVNQRWTARAASDTTGNERLDIHSH